jgi:hypothetical protein
MAITSQGWSRLGRLTLAQLLISFLLIVVLAGHSIVTGVGVPYQDPTPEQVKYERFHNGISMSLFLCSAFSVLVTFVVGMAWVLRSLIRRLRSI